MKKFIMLLGLAAMVSATPVFAATKPVPVKHHVAMCMVHGKKVACPVKHKAHHAHKMVVKKKK